MQATVLQLGALYAIVSLGVCVSFRFMRFPDLTMDGSFVLGAAVTASAVAEGWNCWLSVLASVVCGCSAGFATAVIHRCIGVNKFFAGVLSTMILYSLNLRILGGANLSILRFPSVFSGFDEFQLTLACSLWLLTSFLVLLVFFHTRLGLIMRALGGNESALRISEAKKMFIIAAALAISNGLASLAGSLLSQYQGFADVNAGVGITIGGFAGVFVGEAIVIACDWLLGKLPARVRNKNLAKSSWPVRGELIAGGVGAFAVTGFAVLTLYLGLPPSDNKMVNALLLLLGMFVRQRGQSQLLVPRSALE